MTHDAEACCASVACTWDSAALREVRCLVLDFDGVLTDGTVEMRSDGTTSKRVSYLDVVGITRWRRFGFSTVILSGEESPMLQTYARTYQIDHVVGGCKDKRATLHSILDGLAGGMAHVAYVGDDILDLEAMLECGVRITVPGAHRSISDIAQLVTAASGGAGAVREVTDRLLLAKGIALTALRP